MEDVVQLAQVSRQTVWRVLHAKPRVSEPYLAAERRAIQDAVERSGYRIVLHLAI